MTEHRNLTPQAAQGCTHVFKTGAKCIKPVGHKGRHLRPIPNQVVGS